MCNPLRCLKYLLWLILLGLTPIYCMALQLTPAEFSFAGGFNWTNSPKQTYLVISPYETDSLHILNKPVGALWKLGVDFPVWNTLDLAMSLYYGTSSLSGRVLQFALPAFENYAFNAPYTSTRLMFELKPYIRFYHARLFAILGLGPSIQQLSYRENRLDSNVGPSNFELESNSRLKGSYDLGAGVRKQLTSHLYFSLTYLYTYLGNVSPAYLQRQQQVLLSETPHFKLDNQTLLLGLHWALK